MKKILFILFWATIANGCSQKEIVLRTMTYNTYSGRNAGIEAIADAIRRNNPDLVALQEVERFTELNPGDTPAILAEMTGLKYMPSFMHSTFVPEEIMGMSSSRNTRFWKSVVSDWEYRDEIT